LIRIAIPIISTMLSWNDDAIRAIRLMASKVADAVIEGRQAITKESGEVAEAAKAAGEVSTAPVAEPPAEDAAIDVEEDEESR